MIPNNFPRAIAREENLITILLITLLPLRGLINAANIQTPARRRERHTEKDQLFHALREPHGDLAQQVGAPVMGYGDHSLDTLVVEDGHDIARHGVSDVGLDGGRFGRAAVAETVGCEDAIAAGHEVVNLVVPVMGGGGEAVYEEQGGLAWVGGRAVDVGVLDARGGDCVGTVWQEGAVGRHGVSMEEAFWWLVVVMESLNSAYWSEDINSNM
jgi:hypothetical protein